MQTQEQYIIDQIDIENLRWIVCPPKDFLLKNLPSRLILASKIEKLILQNDLLNLS